MNTTPTSTLTAGKSKIIAVQNKEERTYRIVKYLGRGGYGITYLAESEYFDNNIPQKGIYTIKEFCLSDVCTRLADDSLAVPESSKKEFEESKQSFIHEAQRLMKMSHEGIVPVNAVIETNGTAYYVMQYLGNTTLKDFVEAAKSHRLPEDEACRIACQMADALDYLHSQRVTHLDVKPVNVMMVSKPDGSYRPVLIDFGLACHYKKNGNLTNRHGATGTSDGYSPMEQYAGIEYFSPESDVYALAATLFFMLTGHAPKKAGRLTESDLMEDLKGLGLQKSTLTTLCQAMKKMPDQRTNSVKTFAAQLSGGVVQEDEGGDEGEYEDDGGKTRPRKNPNSKPIPWKLISSIGAAAAVILLAVTITNTMLNQCEDNHQDKPVNPAQEEIVADSSTIQTPAGEEITQPASGGNDPQKTEPQKTEPQKIVSPETKPQKTEPATGSKNYGYAIYKGKMKNGLPHGWGKLSFNESRKIESRDPDHNIAQPGEYVEGEFSNGHLIQGTWHKNDGTTTYLMIGGI